MSASRRGRNGSSDQSDGDVARKKERLDSTIYRLKKEKTVGLANYDEEKTNLNLFKSMENSRNENKKEPVSEPAPEERQAKSVNQSITEEICNESNFRIIPKANILKVFYCMWENISNVCWLDASMALISHNQTLRYKADLSGAAQIVKIIKYYNEAICTLNDKCSAKEIEELLHRAKDLLKVVQESSLKYLQPILKYNEGDPESAFCSLFNLISEDKTIKQYFEVKFTRSFQCEKCGKKKVTTQTKPIITLPKVEAFQPSSPTTVTECLQCKDQEQRMSFTYKTLPKCLIFHFERGAGKGDLYPLDFTVNGREYKITGLMTLEKAQETTMDHFVTWIRDPSSDSWLECNDLNGEILNFIVVPPQYIKLEEVCIIMFEAFDDFGTIEVKTQMADSSEKFNLEDEEVDDTNIPLIDLSQEVEEPSCKSNKEEVAKTEVQCKKTSNLKCSDELAFLESLCIEDETSKDNEQKFADKNAVDQNLSISTQQIEMLKQLDLKPKFIDSPKVGTSSVTIQNNSSNIKQEPSLKKERKDEQKSVSLQDCLSPKYTNIIKELAAKNDELEKNKASQSLKDHAKPKILEQSSSEVKPKKIVNKPKVSNHSAGDLLSSRSPEFVMKVEGYKCVLVDQAAGSKKKGESVFAIKDITTLENSNEKTNSPCFSTETVNIKKDSPSLKQNFISHESESNEFSQNSTSVKKVNNTMNEKEIKDSSSATNELLSAKEDKTDSVNEIKSTKITCSESNVLYIETKSKKTSSIKSEGNNVKDSELKVSKILSDRPPYPIEIKTKILTKDISETLENKSDKVGINEMDCDSLEGESSFIKSKDSGKINWNEINLIVTESEEITPENVAEVIANGSNRNPKIFNRNSPNVLSKSDDKVKRKKSKPFAVSDFKKSDRLRTKKFDIQNKIGKKVENTQLTHEIDYPNIQIKRAVIKLHRLTPEDIIKYNSKDTVATVKSSNESVKRIDMFDVDETQTEQEKESFDRNGSLTLNVEKTNDLNFSKSNIKFKKNDLNSSRFLSRMEPIKLKMKTANKKTQSCDDSSKLDNNVSKIKIENALKNKSTASLTLSKRLNKGACSESVRVGKARGRPRKISSDSFSDSSVPAEISCPLPFQNISKKRKQKKIYSKSNDSTESTSESDQQNLSKEAGPALSQIKNASKKRGRPKTSSIIHIDSKDHEISSSSIKAIVPLASQGTSITKRGRKKFKSIIYPADSEEGITESEQNKPPENSIVSQEVFHSLSSQISNKEKQKKVQINIKSFYIKNSISESDVQYPTEDSSKHAESSDTLSSLTSVGSKKRVRKIDPEFDLKSNINATDQKYHPEDNSMLTEKLHVTESQSRGKTGRRKKVSSELNSFDSMYSTSESEQLNSPKPVPVDVSYTSQTKDMSKIKGRKKSQTRINKFKLKDSTIESEQPILSEDEKLSHALPSEIISVNKKRGRKKKVNTANLEKSTSESEQHSALEDVNEQTLVQEKTPSKDLKCSKKRGRKSKLIPVNISETDDKISDSLVLPEKSKLSKQVIGTMQSSPSTLRRSSRKQSDTFEAYYEQVVSPSTLRRSSRKQSDTFEAYYEHVVSPSTLRRSSRKQSDTFEAYYDHVVMSPTRKSKHTVTTKEKKQIAGTIKTVEKDRNLPSKSVKRLSKDSFCSPAVNIRQSSRNIKALENKQAVVEFDRDSKECNVSELNMSVLAIKKTKRYKYIISESLADVESFESELSERDPSSRRYTNRSKKTVCNKTTATPDSKGGKLPRIMSPSNQLDSSFKSQAGGEFSPSTSYSQKRMNSPYGLFEHSSHSSGEMSVNSPATDAVYLSHGKKRRKLTDTKAKTVNPVHDVYSFRHGYITADETPLRPSAKRVKQNKNNLPNKRTTKKSPKRLPQDRTYDEQRLTHIFPESAPNDELPSGLAERVDCLVDHFLTKTYVFFGFGNEEYKQ